MKKETSKKKFSIRRGIYLLPSLFTLFNFLLGFYAVVMSIKGDWYHACVAVMIAFFADGLDGMIARLTHTTSDFGVELDSLADLMTFGLAPALMIYLRWLQALDVGWLTAFVFAGAAAIRLARFNAYDKTESTSYFNGLPSPAAGHVIISLILLDVVIFPGDTRIAVIAPFVCPVLAFLMVSNIRYPSFKKSISPKRIPFRLLVAILFLIIIFVANPFATWVTVNVIYLLSGLVFHLFYLIGMRRSSRRQAENEEVSS